MIDAKVQLERNNVVLRACEFVNARKGLSAAPTAESSEYLQAYTDWHQAEVKLIGAVNDLQSALEEVSSDETE